MDAPALLRPHQLAPVDRLIDILRSSDAAVDLSDTGTGKTYVGAAVANKLQLPTLVVCPKIARTAWQRAAEHFGDRFTVIGYEALRTGRTPLGWWDNNPPSGFEREEYFQCQSCQQIVDFDDYRPCYCHPIGAHCLITKKRRHNYGKFNFHPGVKFVIFDEAHRCNGLDSLNARMLRAAAGRKVLGLSATLGSSPLQFSELGYLLGLHGGGNAFYSWARRYGCNKLPGLQGFKWLVGKDQQKSIMEGIHNEIIPARGVRVRCDDIPGFPKRDVTTELLDLDGEEGQIDRLYAEMDSALVELEQRSANDSDHPLTKLLRAQQKVELLKVPLAVEMANDFRAKGYTVIIFVNYRQTIEELADRLNTDMIIDGSPAGVKRRDYVINCVQTNQTNLALANSDAGGICISMQDLDGEHPRVGLVMPTYSAVKFKQVLGRLHREGGLTTAHYRVLLAANSCEVQVKRSLDLKLSNLDALNDSDFYAK